IFNIVFFITLLSLVLQGSSITAVASWLKLNEPAVEEPDLFGVEVPEEAGKLAEITLTEDSLTHGDTLKELQLPQGMLVMMIKRDEKFIVPNGKVKLKAGDRLLIISDHDEN
ncbi:MAG: TrkA C-terminal domain-containing protein, partial [Candidatus Cryptobacteroides sp.]